MRGIAVAVIAVLFLALIGVVMPLQRGPKAGSLDSQPPAAAHTKDPQTTRGLAAGLAASEPLSTSIYTAFLPSTRSSYYAPPPCSPDSPFSIQIAALHQVVPGQAGGPGRRTMTEAEWQRWYDEAFPSLVRALAQSGACWTRLRIDWALIQPEPPPADYVWGPYHDEKLALVAEAGVQMVAHVDHVPDWAGPADEGPIDQDRLDEFVQFLTDLVHRYKQPPYNIHHWELFNEPDLTYSYGTRGWGQNGDRYAEMLALAYPAITAADPQAVVLMGGVAYDWFTEYNGPFYRYFPDDVLANGGGVYMDALNFHYFPDFADEWERWVPEGNPPTCGIVDDGLGTPYEAWGIDVIAKARHFRNRMDVCHGVRKPLWLTETGEHGVPGDAGSLAQQARYVIQVYARALSLGIENITWFALVTPSYDPYDQGLLYEDFSPKPAYFTYRLLTQELRGYTFAYTLDVADVEAYVFQDAGAGEKTIAWGSGRVSFAPADSVRVVDREGTETWVDDGGSGDLDGVQNGSIQLQMSQEPVFISR